MVVAAFGQGCSCSTPKTTFQASVTISQPTNNQTIHTSDDEDSATSGIQFSIKAGVNGVTDGSTVTLFLDGQAVTGQTQTVAIVNNVGSVTFAKTTLPAGPHTIAVKVEDKVTAGKTATDTRTVTVDGTNSAACTFLAPTSGQTLKLADDASPAVAGEQYGVQVSCPTLAVGTPVSLTLDSPSSLGGIRRKLGSQISSGATIDFGVVNLSEGANILHFVAAPSTGAAITVDNQITVDTGKCGVWLADATDSVYNAKGELAPGETRTVIPDTKPGQPGEQGTFTAYVDTLNCPAGSQATLNFNGTSASQAAVGTDGKVVFRDVTIPEGDPVVETVSVTATTGGITGDAIANQYHVDSLIPTLTFSNPGTTLTPAQDSDATKPGIQSRVKLATANVLATTTVTIADSAAPNALFGPSPAGAQVQNNVFSLSADTTFSVRTHVLTANATRVLGNKATPATVTTVVGSAGVSVSLVSPTFTNINIANDADPTTPTTCEVDTVVAVSPDNALVQYSINHGTPLSSTAASGQAAKRLSLPQGTSSVHIVAQDVTGASQSIDLTYTCDTVAPTVAFTSPAPNTTVNTQTPSVSVHTSEGAGVTVTINNASGQLVGTGTTDASGNATIVVNLPTGQQTLSASVTDAAGNPSAPATLAITVDTGSACDLQFTAPSLAQQIFNLSNTADASPSRTFVLMGSSTLCKNTLVTFSKALAGTSAEVALGTATTDATTGQFTFTLTMPDGETDTRLFARLGAGTNAGQGSFEYASDFTPPTIASLSPAAGVLKIVSANDSRLPQPHFIADADPTIANAQLNTQVAYSGAGSSSPLITTPGTVVFKSASGTMYATFNTVDDASNTLTQQVTFPDGLSGEVDVVVTDGAGNSATQSWTLGVALTPLPTTFTLTDPHSTINTTTEIGSNRVDRADTRGFAVTSSSVPPGSIAVMCSNVAVPNTSTPCPGGNGYELPGSTITASGTQMLFPDAVVPEGDVTLWAVLVDPVGSKLISTTQTLTVDTVPPQVASVVITEDTNGDNLLNSNESTGAFHVVVTYIGVEDNQATTLSVPGLGVLDTQVVVNNTATFTMTIASDGSYVMQIDVADKAGNPNQSNAVTPHIDNPASSVNLAIARTPPQISITAPTFSTCNKSNDADPTTSACDVTVTVAVSSGVTTVTFQGDGAPSSNVATPTNGSASAAYAIPEGTSRTITVVATDQAGNQTTATRVIYVDTTPPTLAFTSPATGATTTEQNFAATLTTNAEDGQTVTVYSEPTHTLVGSDPASGGSATVAIAAPLGAQTLVATVTDAAGNVSAQASIAVVVTQSGCDLTFSSPSASTTTLTVTTTNALTITGQSLTCLNTQVDLYKAENGGAETFFATVTTDGLGHFSQPATFTDGVTTVLHAKISDGSQTNDFTRTIRTDVTAPTLTVSSPAANSSGQLFIVAETGNVHVKAGEAGYYADATTQTGGQFDLDLTVGGAGDVFGGSGTGSLQVITGTGTTLLSQSLSTNSSTHYSPGTTALPTVTVAQDFVGTIKIIATDSVGNSTTTTWSNVTVDVVAPNAPALVTSDPGTGIYTHVTDNRRATVVAAWTTPTDDGPAGQTLTWDFGYTTSTLLGSTTFDDAAYDNAALTSKVAPGNVGAAGSVVSVTLDKVPTFNTYYLAPRLVDGVGNQSPLATGTVDVTLQKVTLQPSGLTGSGAAFGTQVAVGDLDGDGIADIAVSAPYANNGAGLVIIYYGDSSAGFSRTTAISGLTSADNLGYPIAVGDIDGDGIADLVLGTNSFSEMDIYLGRTGGPTVKTCAVTGFTYLASLFVVDDLNNDGKKDLVVSSYGPTFDGQVDIFNGRSTWGSSVSTESDATTLISNDGTGSNGLLGIGFNSITAIPDVSGDSLRELVITNASAKVTYVLSGSSLGSIHSGVYSSYLVTTLVPPVSGSYGGAIQGIDLGYSGRVDLVFGDGLSGTSNLYAFDQNALHNFVNSRVLDTGTNGFGSTLAVGDLNKDSHQDLIVGTYAPNPGEVDLYLSGATAVPSKHNAKISGRTSFGTSLATGDVTADGRVDLIVSEPSNSNGSVYVYY
jgi:hypothetical protein